MVSALSDLSDVDRDTLLKYASLRKELYDADFDATIVRIEQALTNSEDQFKYHRGCYSNSGRLERLRNKSAPSQEKGCTPIEPSSSRYVTRAQTDRLDINKCIFYQSDKTEALRQVMSDPIKGAG
ncbi:hypothetical protein JTB14_001073 [Gonioctena quinquepunctata]|nr:hypothetical protein JTB14_001073 [Gonioctena quinquepunctata]